MRPFFKLSLAVIAVACSCYASAMAADKSKRAAYDAANEARVACYHDWGEILSASSDPVDYTADAILAACATETKQVATTAKTAHPNASPSAVWEMMKRSARTTVILSRAIAARKTQATCKTDDQPEPEPKTRDGKLARCERDEASWREWAAERGHVRIDMIEEHEALMTECRAAAEKLPTAADFHASIVE